MDETQRNPMERLYTMPTGRQVVVRLVDDGERIEIRDAESGTRVGEMGFEPHEDDGQVYQLVFMQLDEKYRRQGIGRAALLLHRELCASTIWAASVDGSKHQNGGHLTGDGPAFVARMRSEGVVIPEGENWG